MIRQSDSRVGVADAVKGHWVETYAPNWLKPYARLARWDRPIGWWLLLLPCWWSAALAAHIAGKPLNLWHLVFFLVGAVAMRGAGCTYNDIIDRDIDAKVKRTRLRPLPSGQLNVQQAFLFLLLQLFAGLLVLAQFNGFTIILGMGVLPVVALYPFMKRITNWPQLVLGLAFSWGALMGFAATFGALNHAAPFLLYGSAVFWTIGYDTIYAHQDQEDDALIGVRSTARIFGRNSRLMIGLFFTGTLILALAALLAAKAHLWAYFGLGGFAIHLFWQTFTLQPKNEARCLKLFRANKQAGLILFAGLALGLYL